MFILVLRCLGMFVTSCTWNKYLTYITYLEYHCFIDLWIFSYLEKIFEKNFGRNSGISPTFCAKWMHILTPPPLLLSKLFNTLKSLENFPYLGYCQEMKTQTDIWILHTMTKSLLIFMSFWTKIWSKILQKFHQRVPFVHKSFTPPQIFLEHKVMIPESVWQNFGMYWPITSLFVFDCFFLSYVSKI